MKKLNVVYTTFKEVVQYNKLRFQYTQLSSGYLLYTVSAEYFIVARALATEATDFENTLKSSGSSAASEDDALAILLSQDNRLKLTPLTSDGKPIMAYWPTEGDKLNFISPDWTDPTTWYDASVRVVEETATCDNAPTYTVYSVAHQNLIDSYHGKLTFEDNLLDREGNSFRVEVKVNGDIKTEQDPHTQSGGDFIVNYSDGKVTFLSALTAQDTVTVTYHYENGSLWRIAPPEGKAIKIKYVEAQFSADVVLTDGIIYQGFGLVDYFAPQLVEANVVPSGTIVPLGNGQNYKTIRDYVNDSNGAYPVVPVIGGNTWRGLQNDIVIFPWDYAAMTPIQSAAKMEIRVWLEHDVPFQGEYATVTFYCLLEDE